jgi:DNA-binding NarL/FixJ family response regulator
VSIQEGNGLTVARPVDHARARRVQRSAERSDDAKSLVVADVLSPWGQPPGLLVRSVAELACQASFDVIIVSGGDVEQTQRECERVSAGVVLLPIYVASGYGSSLTETLAWWDAPAALCAGLAKRGLLVIAVLAHGPASILAACVAEGAIGMVGTDDVNVALKRLQSDGVVAGNGNDHLPDGALRVLVGQPDLPSHYYALLTLTSSERRILHAIMQGWSASDIAGALVVSLATVRSHIRSILTKLDVSSQVAAVAIGYGVEPGEARAQESCL